MLMRVSVPAALAALLLASPVAARSKVGVIALGADADAAAALQLRLEQALSAQPGIELLGSSELAPRIAAGAAVPADDANLSTLLTLARVAYAEDRPLDAFHRVSEAADLIDAGAIQPGADRSTILVSRAALYHAMGDAELARKEAEALLALAPDVRPEPWLRPAFVAFLEDLRKRQRSVQVTLAGIPAQARVEVDGRIVGATFRVAPGSHELHIRAPGTRPSRMRFEANADTRLTYLAALEPGEKQRASLETAVWETPPDNTLSELGRKLPGIHLVVVSARPGGSIRGLVREPDGFILRSDAFSGANADLTVATWAAKSIAPVRKTVVTGPTPTKPPEHAVTESRPGSAAGLAVRAGPVFVSRQRTLRGSDGGSIDTTFSGMGGVAQGRMTRGAWIAEGRIQYVSFDLSRARFELPDGSKASVLGGRSLRGELAVGGVFLGSLERTAAFAQVEGALERHDAQDLRSGTQEVGLFSSYQRWALGAAIGASLRRNGIGFDVALRAHPLHRFDELESKSGSSPSAGMALGASAGVTARLGRRLEIRGAYEGESRSVSFKGAAIAPVTPQLRDATHRETVHAFSMTAARRF